MELDPHYAFESSEWPNGHYVHSIAGYKEEPMGYHYWLLYRLPELPDPQAPPGNHLVAPVGKFKNKFLLLTFIKMTLNFDRSKCKIIVLVVR